MSQTTLHTPRTARTVARPLTRLAAALLVAGAFSGPLQAQQLIAPTTPVAGFSQGEIMAQFGQWALAYPAANNPVLDTTGAFSHLGDQGAYFFLPGSFGPDPVVRSVTVRPNQTLFLNLMVVTYWQDTPTQTAEEMRALANDIIGNVSGMSITVNGAAAVLPDGYASLTALRQSSPAHTLTVIPDNIGPPWPAGDFLAIDDGWLIAMQGLPLGNHTVKWTFNSSPTGDFAGQFTLAQDITFNVTSVPEPGTWAMMSLGMAAVGAGALRRRRATLA